MGPPQTRHVGHLHHRDRRRQRHAHQLRRQLASQYADFVDSKGGFFDLTINVPHTGKASATINRTGGTVTQDVYDDAIALNTLMMMLASSTLANAAQQGWESGRCIDLTTSVSAKPKGLDPAASVTITAAPRSKIDAGAPVGGIVTALLTGGEASVSPSSTPVLPTLSSPTSPPTSRTRPARFRSRHVPREASARRRSTSTRLAPTPPIVGGLDDFQTDTAVCDVRDPFTLSGGGIDVEFSGGLTGTYSYSGVYEAAGNGEYMITLPDGPGQAGTMDGGGEGTVVSGAAGSGTEHYTLTPITC